MNVTKFHKTFLWYLKKHGLMRLIKLSLVKGWRRINNKEAMFVFDLDTFNIGSMDFSEKLVVVSHNTMESISREDMRQLIRLKSKEVLLPFLDSFFRRGATLWLAKIDDTVVGYVWTRIGGFDGFYSIPIPIRDAITFSAEVFSEFRGRSYFSSMLRIVFSKLKANKILHIYYKCHVSNTSSLRGVAKLASRRIGTLREIQLFNKRITIWDKEPLNACNEK